MYRIVFSKQAEKEYQEIAAYIAQDNLFYALEVLEKIDKCIDVLIDFPNIGKKIQSSWIRIIVEPRYRFKIVYQIQKDFIHIISVFKYKNTWE